MTLVEYDAFVAKMAKKGARTMPTEFMGLGLTGEAGEVVDIIKKEKWHGRPMDKVEMLKELGDVAWYLSALAQAYGFSLEEVLAANVDKLEARYPGGFVEGGGRR